MRREKLNIVTPAADAAEPGRYVLDDQVGFLLRVALQRHTSIFTTRMIEGMTQTQFAALAKLHEVGPCSQNHLGRLIYLDAATIKGVVDRLGARGLTSIFTTRMIEGLTQTQFAALAKLHEVGPCSQNHLGKRGEQIGRAHV